MADPTREDLIQVAIDASDEGWEAVVDALLTVLADDAEDWPAPWSPWATRPADRLRSLIPPTEGTAP